MINKRINYYNFAIQSLQIAFFEIISFLCNNPKNYLWNFFTI